MNSRFIAEPPLPVGRGVLGKHLRQLFRRLRLIVWQIVIPFNSRPAEIDPVPEPASEVSDGHVEQCQRIFDQAEERRVQLEQKAQLTFGLMVFLVPLLASLFVFIITRATASGKGIRSVAIGLLVASTVLLLLGFISAVRAVAVKARETLYLHSVIDEAGQFREYNKAYRARGLLYCAAMNEAMNDHLAQFVKGAHILTAAAVITLVVAAIPTGVMLSNLPSSPTQATIGAYVDRSSPPPPAPKKAPPTPGKSCPPMSVCPEPAPPDVSELKAGAPSTVDGTWFVGVGGLAASVGLGLLVLGSFRKDVTMKAAGIVALFGGLLSHATFIREFKLERLFSIDHPSLTLHPSGPSIDAEMLLPLTGFAPGVDTLPGMSEKIHATVCPALDVHSGEGHENTIIIIGGTDRLPLSRRAQQRFESNFGLAEARAAQARRQILTCSHPPHEVLRWGAGPEDFLDRPLPPGPDPGSPTDRRIEIWAVWRIAPSTTFAQAPRIFWPPTALDLFGYIVGLLMICFYWLERRRPRLGWLFASTCIASALYAFWQPAYPFVLIEVVWAGVAIYYWTRALQAPNRPIP